VRLAEEKMGWKAVRTVEDAVRDAWNWEQNRIAHEAR
jgi:UDP-glucose 4-epimerase